MTDEGRKRIVLIVNKANAVDRFRNIELDKSNVEEVFNANFNKWKSNKINSKDPLDKSLLTIPNFINDEFVEISYYEPPKKTSNEKKKYAIYVDYLNCKLFISMTPKEKEGKMFRDLFKDDKRYLRAIERLKSHNFIIESENSLEWVFKESGFTDKQTIIALIVVLEKKGYLKLSLKAVYDNIKNEFNIVIGKSTYSESHKNFLLSYNEEINNTNHQYLELFKRIL